jgi:hypothetical protein
MYLTAVGSRFVTVPRSCSVSVNTSNGGLPLEPNDGRACLEAADESSGLQATVRTGC